MERKYYLVEPGCRLEKRQRAALVGLDKRKALPAY